VPSLHRESTDSLIINTVCEQTYMSAQMKGKDRTNKIHYQPEFRVWYNCGDGITNNTPFINTE